MRREWLLVAVLCAAALVTVAIRASTTSSVVLVVHDDTRDTQGVMGPPHTAQPPADAQIERQQSGSSSNVDGDGNGDGWEGGSTSREPDAVASADGDAAAQSQIGQPSEEGKEEASTPVEEAASIPSEDAQEGSLAEGDSSQVEDVKEAALQVLPWRERPQECFPDIAMTPIVPEKTPSKLTFPQLRRMLTGLCPFEVPAKLQAVLERWKALQLGMFSGKVPLKVLRYECTNAECGGHADRMKGIVFSFWVAVMSRRAFILKSTRPASLAVAYASNEVPMHESEWAESGVLRGKQWREQKLIGSRKTATRIYTRVASGKAAPLLSVRANAILHTLAEDLAGHVQFKDDYEAVKLGRFSLQLAMDTMFRPSRGLLKKMRSLQLQIKSLWLNPRPLMCVHCRTSIADGKGSRYGDGQYTRLGWSIGWLYPRLRQQFGVAPLPPESDVHLYLASDDPASWKQLPKYATNTSLTFHFHQVSLPVFHTDKSTTRGKGSAKDLYLGVLAEHQLLAMCDGWVMPGSGFPETAFMWAEGEVENAVWLNEDNKKHFVRIGDVRESNHIWVRSSPQHSWPGDPYPPQPPRQLQPFPSYFREWVEWVPGQRYWEKKVEAKRKRREKREAAKNKNKRAKKKSRRK